MIAAKEMTLTASSAAAPVPPTETASAPPASAGVGLPFDPWRIVAAVLRRWHWILLSGAALAVAGGTAGYFEFDPVFTASAQLMRQEPGGTFRASEIGEPFQPRQLSVPTLVSFMKSPAVLQRVSEQTQPRLSPLAILSGLTITPERNTDLITVAFKSTRSGPTAMRVLNIFGVEVVRFTRDLQRQEAADVDRLLTKQLAKADDDLREVNGELLTFSKSAGVVDVDKEIDAYLRKLGDLDMKYESTRIDHDTLDLRIAALEKELAAHNPLADRVQAARDRLADLRTQYTDANPLVADQKDRVAELEKQLSEAAGKPVAPPREGESGLATSFYEELFTLKTQKDVLAAQLEKLKAVRASVDDRLRALPEKGMQYARIKARQQSLETAQSLLASRQREAQLYEDNPLGYYRFFDAKPDQVEIAGRGKKILLLAVAGGVLGAFVCLAFVALAESFDDRLKTVADVRRATKLPVLARLPELESLDAVAQANWAFRTWMALEAKLSATPNRTIVCGLLAAGEGEGRSTWLELLGRAASQREGAVLVLTNAAPRNGQVVDLDEALAAPASIPNEAGSPTWLLAPVQWRWDASRRRQWQAALEVWRRTPGLVVLVELTAADQPDTLLMAESLPQLIWLTASGQARAQQTAERLDLLRHARCQFAGVVINRARPLFPRIPVGL